MSFHPHFPSGNSGGPMGLQPSFNSQINGSGYNLTHSSGLSAPSRTIAPNNGQSLTINNQSQQYSGQPQFPTSMTTTNGYPTNGFATSQQTMQSTVTSIRDGMQSSQQFMSTLPVDSTQNQQPSLLKSAFTAHGSGGQVLSVPSSTQPYGFQPTSSVIPPQPPMNSVGGGTTGPQNVQFSSSNAQLSEQIYSQQSPELLPNSSSGPGTIQQMPSNLHMSGFPLTSSGNSQPNSSLLPGENSRASQHNFTPKGGIPSTPNAMQGFGSVPGPILQRTNENSAPGMPGLPARPISQNPPVGMPVPPMGTMPQNFQPGMPVPPTGSMPQNPPQPGMPVPPMGTMSQNFQPGMPVPPTGSMPQNPSHPGMPVPTAGPMTQNPPQPGMPVAPAGLMPQSLQPGMPVLPAGPMSQNPSQHGMSGPHGIPSQSTFSGAPGMPGYPQLPGGPPGPYPGSPGYQNAGMPQRQPSRLDPNLMPSAVQVMDDDTAQSGKFPTGYPHANCPPLVSTDYIAEDQGNCNPRLMRSTLYMAPASNDLLKASQIPFAVACSPFAAFQEQEQQLPIIDLGPGGPVRCQRCKAYMCPFMEFQDGGRRFRCPFCHATTPVEDVYFAHLDHMGRRTDIEHRPELFLGAYEFVATKQYCKNGLPPKEPAFIFMIDVSYNAIQNGMLNIVCKNLERVLQNLPKEVGAPESAIRIGLATFDHAVHFFDLSSTQPSMMVIGDVSDMFVPIVDGLLLPYSQAVMGIRAVLAEIPHLFEHSKVTETMLGPVVQAGLDALQCADRAGKLFIFSTLLPTYDAPGKLKAKNDRNLLGTEKEKSALVPQSDFYTKLGELCVKNAVTVDLFLFPNAFIDIATISQLSAVTGGSVYKYQYFMAEKDANRFLYDLEHNVSRQIAFDCMVRVRSSAGIRPVTFHGSFFMENSTDLEMSSIDEDKAFFVELKHDDKLSDPSAIIQCAVLFTSVSGQRRLRIINLCLPVSSDYNQLYRVADQGALTTLLLKIAVQVNREKGNKDMKEQLYQRCAQILATYREKCNESAPLGQLILPETLKLLPLYVNCIIKNDALSGGSEMTVDDKVWMIELIRGMRVEDAMLLLYPSVYPVSTLELQNLFEMTSLTNAVRGSIEYLDKSKAYFIDNGVLLFLWIGLGVAEAWVQDVFGANSVALLNTENHIIPEKDNPRSRGIRRAMELLQRKGLRRRNVFIVREGDSLEPWMKKFLVEDKAGPNSMSYVDFLCHIHREIRNILS